MDAQASKATAMETPLRQLEEQAGAKFGTWFECVLPDSFAPFETEYRWAGESVALVDKNYRAWFRFTGPDRARYLNAVLTNDIRGLKASEGNISLLLNPQGHILAEIETYAMDDALLCVSYAMIRERLAATLEKYIIMDDVTLEDVSDKTAAVALEGPKTPAIVRELCGVELESMTELGHVDARVAGIPCLLVRRSPGGIAGAEFISERERIGEIWSALEKAARAHGGGPIGFATLNVLRLEAGMPWFGYDFDETVIPHEAGLEHSHINYEKGCYTGQEIVERVRSRGHVNKQRVGLRFTGDSLPERGAALTSAGKEAGHVTRAGFSPALGAGIGMGYVRREFNAPGSPLERSGGRAEVIELPIRGKSESSPAKADSE
jgi:folate-binding protein YgfZ